MISIVVPIYNVEQYLRRCLESIVAQTFTDWECILVDDGSPDKCGVICDEYAAKDSRFKVIHQENQGVTRAREMGVTSALGEFIIFVDSDDTLPFDALRRYINAISEDIDIIAGRMNGEEDIEDFDISVDEYRRRIIMARNIHVGPVAKLYRARLFNEWCFDIPSFIKRGEDMLMNIRLAFNAKKKVRFINSFVYCYEYRESSVTNTFVSDVEYERKFLELKYDSVPSEYRVNYEKEILHRTVLWWLEVYGLCEELTPSVAEFAQQLHQRMKLVDYRLPFKLYLLFGNRLFFRKYIIRLIRFFNNLQKK